MVVPYSVSSEIQRIVERILERGVKWIGIGLSCEDYRELSRKDQLEPFKNVHIIIRPDIPRGHFYFNTKHRHMSAALEESFMYCTFLDRPRTFHFDAIECGDPMCTIEKIHKE